LRAQLAKDVDALLPVCRERAKRQMWAARSHSAAILTYDHPAYPRNVYNSNNAVPLLFACGNLEIFKSKRAVACVGTRQIRQPYTALHQHFARVACEEGFAIVSGFALGADTEGHTAALECKGSTVCVMPGGLDRPFPPENRALWDRLLASKGGIFISECPFG